MEQYKILADLIFPNITLTIEDYEKMYPSRDLDKKAIVSRYAPSPTGFIHIGALLASFIGSTFARQTNGKFYLRIEDTDTKRTMENGISKIINGLKEFDISFDEGPISETEAVGNYGPYIQSERKEIYQAFIKELIKEGKAYPCFCSQEELEELREYQAKKKMRIGYYGKSAKCRNIAPEEAIERIQNGEKYIIRLKSPGNFENKVKFNDVIRGQIEMPENDIDIIILKGDGLPTYHFAHLVDDHLMHTTHVVRGDEWLPSLPLHIQLFEMFGFEPPKYVHISPLMKNDNGTVRKLSKRKDPECAMSYYHELGLPKEAVMLYLATIANSNFEEWYNQNQEKTYLDFKFEFAKMNKSGALFDIGKVNNISKIYMSRLKATDLYERALEYYQEYDKDFYDLLIKYKDQSIRMLNIEREVPKPRKDLSNYSDIKKQFWYMYDELFDNDFEYEYKNITDLSEIKNITSTYINKYYDVNDNKEEWFNKIKALCDELGYASDMKAYKAEPDKFKGNVADVSTALRVALTKCSMTPDLYEIMAILGVDRIKDRYNRI
ncbi:MAG TPA: glutamate--tRNA ligase [Bacilli bacterium]|nr:glutamate--tRNA ligase [Bacilli bacterium]